MTAQQERVRDPRPFTIYRNRRGAPRWYQTIVEAWWILTRRHSLHSAWQAGLDEGHRSEYTRLIRNKAYLAEVRASLSEPMP